MKLRNSNPNGCNIVIYNLHPMLFFFPKILKFELNKSLQSLLEQRFCNYAQTITLDNFHFNNQNGMIQSFPLIYKSRKQISNFLFQKNDFLKLAWIAKVEKETTYHVVNF